MSKCWTCMSEHDPDEACQPRPTESAPVSQLFGDPVPRQGPVFLASYESECDSCGFAIWAGDQTRADGSGGWVHEQCEEKA